MARKDSQGREDAGKKGRGIDCLQPETEETGKQYRQYRVLKSQVKE